ncbi:MAG TPA: hypothetical protein LFW21_05555 [Rickettsia endosymbiont of Pyrocoelia pectoralis]|nr:hypothetical protein [Rickettsia endosymbiont of Pyrocoelia pectoralis]
MKRKAEIQINNVTEKPIVEDFTISNNSIFDHIVVSKTILKPGSKITCLNNNAAVWNTSEDKTYEYTIDPNSDEHTLPKILPFLGEGATE